jgi:hypothetical protein
MARGPWLAAVAALIVVACGGAPALGPAPPATPRLAVSALPSLDRWRQHVTEEILPFWTTPAALGDPVGNFPTFRCNDGEAFHPEAPCPELKDPPRWIAAELGRDYTRMKSRQTFLYGVAYHLTGEERYLGYARAGVAWLRAHAYEHDTGSAVSYWADGKPGPAPDARTTQDLAYAQVGLAFYYYLTRDPDVLADLVRLERHVMSAYWDAGWGMLRWARADGDTPGDAQRQELVAQLDQINAYLLLVTPLLEDAATAAAWRADLTRLAHVIRDRYWSPPLTMFRGTLHEAEAYGTRHMDFGHSMKALWMLYLTGEVTGDPALVAFAEPKIAPLLARAAQASGCWASEPRSATEVARGSQWWISAELDQAAATLAGRAPTAAPYAGYLAASYACWFANLVDHRHHDVWPGIPPDFTPAMFADHEPIKVHQWKNGYHVMEHALVAMITTAGLTGQRLPLYYAFARPPAAERIRPYYFTGRIVDDRAHPLAASPGLTGRRVEFAELR